MRNPTKTIPPWLRKQFKNESLELDIISRWLVSKNSILGHDWSDGSNWHVLAVKFLKCTLIVKWDGKSIKENAPAVALSQAFDRF